jgi:DeoR family transcriptional regulator, suf operon transcriptional repressor
LLPMSHVTFAGHLLVIKRAAVELDASRMGDILRQQLLDTSRGRIVSLLRAGGRTVDDIATKLGLTRSAVRLQLAAIERDGVVTRVGKRPGTTRPSHVFELTREIEQLLSKAYVPLLTTLVDVFAEALPAQEVETLLRRTGRELARELSEKKISGAPRSRAAAASKLMNEHLGALTRVAGNGAIVIRGAGCPLAALTGKHRGVCLAMESLVTEIVGAPVRECCDRDGRPRCCFEVESPTP